MRKLITLLVPLTAITLHGCTTVTSFAKLEPQLKGWEENHEYGRTLDALAQVDPKDPDYATAAKRRQQVEKQAADYERRIRKETQSKLKKGDWAAALDQFDNALRKHPKSAVIKDGLAKLNQQQAETLDALERKRLIQHGEWLRDVIPVFSDIARVDPRSSEAQARLERVEQEAVGIASELALLGNKALADNDLKVAEETLPLAVALNSDPVAEESLKELRAKQKQAADKKRKLRKQKERKAQAKKEKKRKKLEGLVNGYKQAFAAQDYITARKNLADLEKLDRRYSGLKDMKGTLQAAIDNKVTHLFDAGVSAYSRGQFEQAAKAWRGALELDSDHQQARENLDRAQKVLEKIKSLKSKQGG